jgi:hypothetical protein
MSTPETSTECSSSPSPIHPRGRGRWVIWVIGFALLLMFGFMLLMMKLTGAGLGMGGALQMAAAQYTRKDVVGDLGGMPVTIPRHMAEFVEYEGDPGWGEKRHGPRPERTHASKLTSFGIQFRYPDMVTLSNAEMWQDKKSKSIFVTDWMDIGVTTGNRYAKDGFLDRLMQGTLKASRYTQVLNILTLTVRARELNHAADYLVRCQHNRVRPQGGKLWESSWGTSKSCKRRWPCT